MGEKIDTRHEQWLQSGGHGGLAECPFDSFYKAAFFAKYQALALGEIKILARLRIALQPGAIGLVSRQIFEFDQLLGYIICAFGRQEIADKVSAAA